ncbi:Uncharacterised protein [Vibrio cholerae]|nr:Uncharacterised protein [Vibrio cholerae]
MLSQLIASKNSLFAENLKMTLSRVIFFYYC